jgi:hypothetical protein
LRSGESAAKLCDVATPDDNRRSSPRAAICLGVTLARRHGNPVRTETVDVGLGGMRVWAKRPLTIDELLSFELAVDGTPVAGRARVMREERRHVYALCFEELGDEATHMLLRLVARG